MRTKSQAKARSDPISNHMPKSKGTIQRACSDCPKKRKLLQRRAVSQSEPAAVPSIVHEVLRSPGQSLDPKARAFMETRFAHEFSHVPAHSMGMQTATDNLAMGSPDDAYEQEAKQTVDRIMRNSDVVPSKEAASLKRFDFSHVRVHTDAHASESAQTINALAYTIGQNVVFRSGRYEPGTKEGRKLLAHELTHVVQQSQNQSNALRTIQREAVGEAAITSACTDPVFYIHIHIPLFLLNDRYLRNGIEINKSEWENKLIADQSRQNSCEIQVSRKFKTPVFDPTINAYLIYTRTPCCSCFTGTVSWDIYVNGNRQMQSTSMGGCPGPICCIISKSVPLNISIAGYTISGTATINGDTHLRNWQRPPPTKQPCPLNSEVPLSNCLCPKERVNPQSNTCCQEGRQAGQSGKCESKKSPPPLPPEKVEMQFKKDAPQWWYDPASSLKVSLTPDGMSAFDGLVAKMRWSSRRVRLEGYASSDKPANDDDYNRRLTDRRVRLIASELEKQKIPRTRFDSPSDQSVPSGCEEIDNETTRGLLSCGDEGAKVPADPRDRKVVASLFQ
jgi:hypothetical protein